MRRRVPTVAALLLLVMSSAGTAQLRIERLTASTDDRSSSAPYSFPPGVRMGCHARLTGGDASNATFEWELRRGGTPVEDSVIVAAGDSAAFRLPAEEGHYEVVVTAHFGGETATSRAPVEVKRRSYPAMPIVGGPPVPGAALQRTMTLLATSTPDRRNEVRVLSTASR